MLILLRDPKCIGANLVSCVLYTKAVARLPLRQLGFLVVIGTLKIQMMIVTTTTTTMMMMMKLSLVAIWIDTRLTYGECGCCCVYAVYCHCFCWFNCSCTEVFITLKLLF